MEFIKKNKGIIIFIFGLLALVAYNWDKINIIEPKQAEEYSQNVENTYITTEKQNVIMVDIKGEVKYPGLYEISSDKRVGDAISLAGGATIYADLSSVNLAQKLTDEMVVIIPRTISQSEPIMVEVEIKGEVLNPGVYTIYKNSNVQDLINKAGGLTEFADTSNIPLVKILIDNETIIIPKIHDETSEDLDVRKIYVEIYGEVNNPGVYLIPETYNLEDLIYEAGGITSNCDLTKIKWDINLCQGAKICIPSYQQTIPVEEENGKININTAKLDELMTLPGIGQIIGQRIIDYRAEFGDFICIEDIMLVSGIKDSIYEQIKELITV